MSTYIKDSVFYSAAWPATEDEAGFDPSRLTDVPGDALVVEFVPQLAMLEKAASAPTPDASRVARLQIWLDRRLR